MGKWLDALDHPVVFAIAITAVVLGTSSLLTYMFKSLGWSGPAALTQHP